MDTLDPLPVGRLIRSEAVARLGFELEELDPETGYLYELRGRGKSRVLVLGLSPINDAGSARLAADKFYTAMVLKRAGFKVPRCARCLAPGTFELSNFPKYTGLEPARRFAAEHGFPLVVKPNRGSRGRDVVRVDSLAELEAAVETVWQRDYLALVQERIQGFDLRLDFLDEEYLLGYSRQPVVLTGDGETSLGEQLGAWDPRFVGEAFEASLESDPMWKKRVLAQGLSFGSILPAGEKVALSEDILNLNRLCVATMVRQLPGPWLRHCSAIARALQLRYFGIDFKVPNLDPDLAGDPAAATVIEVNATPGLGQTYRRGETELAIRAQMRLLEAILDGAL